VAASFSTASTVHGCLAVDCVLAVGVPRCTMNARLVLAQVPALPELLSAARDGAGKWLDLLVDVSLQGS
jgi:hypothetical protein